MSTQHTPGPWQVHDVGQVLLQDQIGMLEQGRDSHDEWVSVGEYDNEGALSVVALCHPANAHLIAAAPAMYQELSHIWEVYGKRMSEKDAARLESILAQAEGRGDT